MYTSFKPGLRLFSEIPKWVQMFYVDGFSCITWIVFCSNVSPARMGRPLRFVNIGIFRPRFLV
jgi:hypothetical protein